MSEVNKCDRNSYVDPEWVVKILYQIREPDPALIIKGVAHLLF